MNCLPIKGYEGLYTISDTGRVFSQDRVIKGKDNVLYRIKGRERKLWSNKNVQYLMVALYKNNVGKTVYVHRLVAETFIKNDSNKPEVNHIDGNRLNNCVSNLEWCTRLENIAHAITTGLHIYTNRMTKSEFVECLNDVINGESYLSLSNRTPYKVPFLSVKLRRIAKELGLEQELDESLHYQKLERARKNGLKNRRNY